MEKMEKEEIKKICKEITWCPKQWADMIHGGYDRHGGEDLKYEKISIMDSVSHAISWFDLKIRLEDALKSILLEIEVDQFLRKFSKK